jgi:sugar lactone lactonase YvrE
MHTPPHRRPSARLRGRIALLTLSLVLAACGGGGGGTPAAGDGTSGGSTPAPPAATGPAIVTQPVSQSVVAGQAATFSVEAAAGTATGYQWQRDGKDIPGATGLTYTLANPQAVDNGSKFTAVVTGASGKTTSSAAVLTVSVPKGLAIVAGTPGGPGNLDGTDGRLLKPGPLAMQPGGPLYVLDGVDTGYTPALRKIDLATGALTTVLQDPALQYVVAFAFDAAGNLYDIAPAINATGTPTGSATAIYRTAPGGQRALFAGSPDEQGSVDGNGTTARFGILKGIAVDAAGNLYVNDGGKKIRKVSPGGAVVTLAGSAAGLAADGTGTQAAFTDIEALAAGPDGSLAALDNSILRDVSPSGVVTTRKGVNGQHYPYSTDIALDSAGNVYMMFAWDVPRVWKIAPDGTLADVVVLPASGLLNMSFRGLAIDAAGDVYVGNETSRIIYRAVPHGTATTFAGRPLVDGNADGTGAAAQFSVPLGRLEDAHFELAADAAGNVYVGETDRVRKVTRDGVVTTLALPGGAGARYYPGNEAVDGSVLVVANGVISRIDATGVTHFIAGQAGVAGTADGVGAKASFSTPQQLLPDEQGNVWLTDFVRGPLTEIGDKTYLRKIAPDGTVTTLASDLQKNGIIDWCAAKDGKIHAIEATMNVVRIAADGSRTVVRPRHGSDEWLTNIASDRNGNLYLALREGPRLYSVRKITPDGTETVIAGKPDTLGVRAGTPGSLGPIDAITVAPDGTVYVMSENTLVRILQ